MISRDFHEPQMEGTQKQNSVANIRMQLQHQKDQQHQHPHPQFINDQRSIQIVENNSLLQRPVTSNGLNYITDHPIICQNMSTSSQIHQRQQTPPIHTHSIVTNINNAQMPTIGSSTSNTIFDPRIGRLYSTGSNTSSTNDFLDNALQGIPNLPNSILINNFTQIPPEASRNFYQASHSINSTQQQPFQHQIPSTLQLQHSSSPSHENQHHHHHQQQQHNQPHSLHQQIFSQPHISADTTASQAMQLHLPTNQPFYVTADSFSTGGNNAKMSAYLPSIITSSLATNLNELHGQQQLPMGPNSTSPISTKSSPVVLDRINICINNHYSDSGMMSTSATNGTSSIIMPEDAPPLPSPIIPTIQHSGTIDPALLIEPLTHNSEIISNPSPLTPVPPVISEPDSTTTSNTPPTTPENPNPVLSIIQSPSTSSPSSSKQSSKSIENQLFATKNLNKMTTIETENMTKPSNLTEESVTCHDVPDIAAVVTESSFTPQFSHSMLETQNDLISAVEVSYSIGEDVFVRKEDNRLYLGTVKDSRYQKYRVRFDDKSEVWCSSKDMRKFGGNLGDTTTNPGGEISNDEKDFGTLCVSCKIRDNNGIEICERCGRGYHRKCTTELIPGSDDWLCKRCDKPMKLDPSEIENDVNGDAPTENPLPYDIKSLTWDDKHRVNEEQIYCYCGKTGQFDHNMLQCCKCLNWFHTTCVENFREPMLRGDGYFVFCCSICSTDDGNEFLRRLQIPAVDFIHLVLYNLSAQKKHQQHKYHHLTKDICPFILSQRHSYILPEEWYDLSEDALKDRIAATLKQNADRFVCGREVKRDCYFYGLRNNGPPIPPKICIQDGDELSDKLLMKQLGLKLSTRKVKHSASEAHTDTNSDKKTKAIAKTDIYEFHSDKEDIDEDGKFTSDDDIPIKHILEKENEKKQKSLKVPAELKKEDCHLDCSHMEDLHKSVDGILVKHNEKRNHKRKAFTLSKPYKETAAAAASKRYHRVRICDTSSDDNSSSSRGTSLDLIIPPPKNFLGLNNPFRNVTPKKNSDKKSRCNSGGGTAVKNSFVTTSSLDFSSKLAALKSAGIFPNLNTTSFAKAAGQPRMVRTIKRRLSAKDIMIGPNQEVRRRRTRRLSSNVEVISTTTINPLPSNIFPLNAKEYFSTAGANVNNTNAPIRKQNLLNSLPNSTSSSSPPQSLSNSSTSSVPFKENISITSKMEEQMATCSTTKLPTHGRRLRTRTQKPVVNNSRRSSLSGASTSSTSSSCTAIAPTINYPEPPTFNDLQQSVNKYFGIGNRITTGEKFSVYAKRHLPNGQVQYLIEWGNENEPIGTVDSITNGEHESVTEIQKNIFE